MLYVLLYLFVSICDFMKSLSLFACVFWMSSLVLSSQSVKPNYSLLWEVSGGELKGKSYVFGSVHINDVEAFDFPDSLLWAMKNCDAFAAEVEMDSFGLIMIDVLLDEFLIQSDTTDDNSSSEDFSINPDGKQTFMDIYLHRIAKVLGKETYGLESMIDHADLMSLISEDDSSWDLSQEEFNTLVELYSRGDIVEMANRYTADIPDDLDMVRRNRIQANSIVKLGKIHPTFSVVGAAHLFGEENVLDLLSSKGYSVRKIKYTQTDGSELEDLYTQDIGDDWAEVLGYSGGYKFLSPNQTRSSRSPDGFDINFDMELDLGLIYMTMSKRLSGDNGRAFLIERLNDLVVDEEKIISIDSTETSEGLLYELEYEGVFTMKMNLRQFKNIAAIQMVMGVSKSSLNSSHVDRYLNGLSELESSDEWSYQQSDNGAFRFYFEDDVSWQVNSVVQPDFKERGKVDIHYKLSYDSDQKNSYIVRYHHQLPGVTYTNELVDLNTIASSFATQFDAKVISVDLIKVEGYNGADVLLRASQGGEYYIRIVIRGSYLYVLLQVSEDAVKNEKFLSSLSFVGFGDPVLDKIESIDDGFAMSFPAEYFKYISEDDGDEVLNFEGTDVGVGATVSLEVTRYGEYDEYILHDSLFTIENLDLDEKIDSILHFESYDIEDEYQGWEVTYPSDSSMNVVTEIEMLRNGRSFYFLILTPEEVDHDNYVNTLIESLEFENDPATENYFTDRKLDLILNNLTSKDSLIHSKALAAFAEYDNFMVEDEDELLSLFDDSFIDDAEPYNTHYNTVFNLHDFEGDEVEKTLVEFYHETNNESVREIILESLAKRDLDSSLPRFFEVLNTGEPLHSYPDDFYSVFLDSLPLYEESYAELFDLAKKDIAVDAFFYLSISWSSLDSTKSLVLENQTWYDEYVTAKIVEYEKDIVSDSLFNPDAGIMDYYYYFQDAPSKRKLYDLIEKNSSNYGLFRMLGNQIVGNETVDAALMNGLFDRDMYYLYWLAKSAQENERMDLLSEELLKVESMSEGIINRYVYDNYSVELQQCELLDFVKIEEVQGIENMAFVECVAGAETEGKYYGLVGSFSDEGVFLFDDDSSVYYNTPQITDDPSSLLSSMLDYLKNQ